MKKIQHMFLKGVVVSIRIRIVLPFLLLLVILKYLYMQSSDTPTSDLQFCCFRFSFCTAKCSSSNSFPTFDRRHPSYGPRLGRHHLRQRFLHLLHHQIHLFVLVVVVVLQGGIHRYQNNQ